VAANTTTVTEQDIEDLEALLREMKKRATEAHDRENVILLSIYAELVRVVSPEVQRFRARLDREENAAINKQHKAMRKAKRAASSNGAQP
jgi:hypothetical protein